jgi:putative ABC transport system permease protein
MALFHDVRFALRLFVKRPGFSLVAVLTLALGIGATTSMFSVVEAVLLRPLPFPEPDRLMQVRITGRDGTDFPLPEADFHLWRAQNDTADAIAVFTSGPANVTGDGQPERLISAQVTDQFFTILGAHAEIGRALEDGDDRPGRARTAVISHALWRRRYAGRADVLGHPIVVAGSPHTIIGVMPPSFTFPRPQVDVWEVLTTDPPARRGPFYLTGLARLKRGVTIDRFRANLAVLGRTILRQYPGPGNWSLTAKPLHEATVGDVRRVLSVLLGAVAVLLLIATVNVANLLLARAATRDREIAVRGALGAARHRLVLQLVTESLVLSSIAGVVGLALSAWGTRALLAMAPDDIPRIAEVRMNLIVFAFSLGAAALCGVLFGLAPAMRASTTRLVEALKEGGRTGTAVRHRRAQQLLVVAEIALALVLSIGAGLLIRSFAALERVSPGFEQSHLLTFRLALPRSSYDGPKTRAFYTTLVERLESTPGVRSAGLTISLPPNLLQMTDAFTVEGQVLGANDTAPLGPLIFVDDRYFSTLRIPLVRGRGFTPRDAPGSSGVVVVNESLARKYFPNVDPVGRQLKIGGQERPNNPWMTIVGVVGDVKYDGLATPVDPTVYLPFLQNTNREQFVVVAAVGDPRTLAASARAIVASLDTDLPAANVKTMDQVMTESVAPPRFRTTLIAIFAAIGLALAAIGIYGVMAYAVTERTHELGVRLALGASASDVIRLVLGESIALAAIGILVGLGGALATTRLMASLLFGVTPTDATTFAGVAGVLAATALLASWIPVRRATRVDPMLALRSE